MDTSKVLLNDNELVVAYGASTKEQRADWYQHFKIGVEDQDNPVLHPYLFIDVSYPLYELWENGDLIGLLNVDVSQTTEDGSTTLCINVEAVMLIAEARGRGLSVILGNTAAEHIATTYQLDKISPEDNSTVYVIADLESEAGSSFVEGFYQSLCSFNSDAEELFQRDWGF
ncbi:hypothetical protein K6U19_08275 [Vibrio fluvialis]|uniref:hypothetical protein n=1 Tax=Vibrio fluvialis TaxID=676 RepID=UPI001EEA7F46|nr:hypothetical protein [Vibrio fluvialis]MCG6341239.1 hypothetical protein [Vibrio fluvialis]